MDNDLVEKCARAMCGHDVEWRDCETPCMQANRCAGEGYKVHLDHARAIIPIVLEAAAKELEEKISSEFGGFWTREDLLEEVPGIVRALM